ncbi:MAG: glycoside hydrolase family 3 N-terminal domain-containing protein [Acidobacteriota bacterium]
MSGRRWPGGELLVLGLSGPRLTMEEGEILREVQPFGLILFGRNLVDIEQTLALTAELKDLLPEVVLSIDAEGGRVDRLASLVGPAPAASRLAEEPPRRSEQAGRWVGAALAHFGIGLDFAPVVDLDHGQTANALDDRYFGSTPRAVIARAGAFLRGLRSSGVEGCLKHFPGLGMASADTHFEGASIEGGEGERDFAPFLALADTGAPVMVAHAAYPGLDPSGLPATLSKAICTDLLRDRMGYNGVALSDDLEMKALDRWGDLPSLAVQTVEAGCDGILLCSRTEEAPSLAAALSAPRLADRRQQAASRLETLRQQVTALSPCRRWSLETVRQRLRPAAG